MRAYLTRMRVVSTHMRVVRKNNDNKNKTKS
jgi:hypothetical protein